MKKLSIVLMLLAAAAAVEAQAPPMKTTGVMVLLTVKPDVSRSQINEILPTEVRDTVRLYLDGKIREWYSRADGKGVIFLMDCKDTAEAQALMEALPLGKAKLANFEYIPVAPLAPLGLLVGNK